MGERAMTAADQKIETAVWVIKPTFDRPVDARPIRSKVSFISKFLANVNSRSRSLYAIARASVCRLSVCRLSSVTFVHPTQAVQIFGNISTALVRTLAIH